MATDTLMFDLLAKDSASGAFKDLARSATVAAGEMHAVFADPVTAKIKTEGFDSYMAKLAEVKAANDLAIGDIQAKTMKLTEGADAAGRELDAMAAKLDGAGSSADRNGGKFRGLLNTLSGFGGKAGGFLGPGLAQGAGIAGMMAAVVPLASALTAAAGAGGILGLAVVGDVKHFMALKQQIDAAQKSLDGATPGTKAYADAQAKLNGLLKTQRQEYGPMMAGVDAISKAWSGFLDKTRGPVMRLMGEGLTVAADALRQFAPVANAAARAMMPLLQQVDRWVKGSGFREFLGFLRTTGAQALADFAHFIGSATGAFLNLMTALAPAARAMSDFLGHLSGGKALGVLAAGLAALTAGFLGVTGPVALVVAGLAGLTAAIVVAWKHSRSFRQVATKAFEQVKAAVADLVDSAKAFWAQWGDLITKYGIDSLKVFLKDVGANLSMVMHVIAAFLDVLSGHWGKAWDNIKAAAINSLSSLPGQMAQMGVHIMEGLINGIGSMAQSLISKIQSIASSIPGKFAAVLGIASPSKVMHRHGQNVMDGLINGLKSREANLQKQLQHTASQISAALSFDQSFAGNVFSAGLPTTRAVTVPGRLHRQVVNGQTVITSTPATTKTVHLSSTQVLAEMFRYQRGQLHQDTRLEHQVAKLKREGLSSSLIAQMESAGTAGLAEIAALASASPSQVRRFNRLNAQTNTALANAGAQAVAGKSMATLRRRQAHKTDEIEIIRKALHGVQLTVHQGHGHLRVTG